jgi:hypothetical protein
MNTTERKLLTSLLSSVPSSNLHDAVNAMWQRGLLNRVAIERLYIQNEVNRRVRGGEAKMRAIEQLSSELGCSYEKVRGAVYSKTNSN